MTAFESLGRRRRAYVDAARDNGFEEGLRKLLADLYPDNAHFIYELLQNAEDAHAREVTFDLREDGLQVEHDGTRLFDLDDIDSITGIGQSTKAGDTTSIGKFGVGFKAVFAYTLTPIIHSGDHSFAIHDLFVPTRVKPASSPGLTTFWFPFDREDKPASHAVEEVRRALRDVSRSTLLFLNHITTITCLFPDGDERLLERRHVSDQVIAIESAHEDAGPSYWYRITGDVPIGGKTHPVAAALALDKHEETADSRRTPKPGQYSSAPSPEFTVRPVDGQVFIYFPAVSETSGLKFHIHAPFASTVARDSVRDDDGNDQLVAGIADIVAASLPDMRKHDLVGDGLLAVLPNNTDDLPVRYSVVRERILEAFQLEPITPAIGGGTFSPSRELIRSASQLRGVLAIEDADLLRKINSSGAVAAVGWLPERDGRPGQFLDSLEAIAFGSTELAEVLDRLGDISREVDDAGDDAQDHVDADELSDLATWTDWIASKNDKWLRSFYAALGRLAQQGHNPYERGDHRHYQWEDPLLDSLGSVPILRVQAGPGVYHVTATKAFLPIAPGLKTDGLVLDTLIPFTDGETRAEKQEANALREFYSTAGVKEWDAAAQLDARFRNYKNTAPRVDDDHLSDLATLVRLLEKRAVSPETYKGRQILVGVKHDGSVVWSAPSGIYLDEPFAGTGLSTLYRASSYDGWRPVALSSDYLGCEPDVGAIAKGLGAVTSLKIERAPIWANPQFEHKWRWSGRENYNRVNQDWILSNFQAIVDAYDPRLLEHLWEVVVTAPESCGVAVYQANGSSKQYRIDSQLLQGLRKIPWILDRNGNLRLPEDTTKDDLAESLTWREAPLLRLSGFGRAAEVAAAKQRGDEARAKELGFDSAEVAREVAKAYNRDPEGFKDFLSEWNDRQATVLPLAGSAVPERRAKRVAEQAAEAPERQYERRARSIRVQQPGFRDASKQYLRTLYTNDDGVLTCQICLAEMPFKIDGEYYFEAVQFVRMTQRDLQENALALCPTCSAKYRKALGTSNADLRDDLLTQDVGTAASATVNAVLAGRNDSIRFVGTHAIDLQAALEATDLDIDEVRSETLVGELDEAADESRRE